VLGFPASEAARILDTSQESVTSALKRARAALERHQRSSGQRAPAPPNSAAEQQLVDRLTRAFETASGTQICAMTRFASSILPRFGLPATLSS
jgi:hypothetical protein